MVKLSNCISIIVPSTMGIADKTSADNVALQIAKVSKQLAILNGGTTNTKGLGTWYSTELGKLVEEDVTIVKSYCQEYNIEELVAICEELKSDMQQEAVSLIINEELYLI